MLYKAKRHLIELSKTQSISFHLNPFFFKYSYKPFYNGIKVCKKVVSQKGYTEKGPLLKAIKYPNTIIYFVMRFI